SDVKSGRDLSAWIGLTPKPHSTGGKERLGRISKISNRYLRRRLYLGAIAQVSARRRGEPGDDWLWHGLRPFVRSHHPPDDVPHAADRSKLQRKTPEQAAIALANRMARTAYALMKNQTEVRAATAA
ncbi:transposase, partial [Roseovarius sp. D22-M7]|uniref:transposase n=1 Tax=Roseovarius sp. D22-M7 TaxID=3127116 RepID=UPI0030101244